MREGIYSLIGRINVSGLEGVDPPVGAERLDDDYLLGVEVLAENNPVRILHGWFLAAYNTTTNVDFADRNYDNIFERIEYLESLSDRMGADAFAKWQGEAPQKFQAKVFILINFVFRLEGVVLGSRFEPGFKERLSKASPDFIPGLLEYRRFVTHYFRPYIEQRWREFQARSSDEAKAVCKGAKSKQLQETSVRFTLRRECSKRNLFDEGFLSELTPEELCLYQQAMSMTGERTVAPAWTVPPGDVGAGEANAPPSISGGGGGSASPEPAVRPGLRA